MLTQINRAKLDTLDDNVKEATAALTDEQLLALASALHAGRISAGQIREQEVLKGLTEELYPTMRKATKKDFCSTTWDFIDDDAKILIDSKSCGYNRNTPAEKAAAKYLETNTEGYRMIMLITNEGVNGQSYKDWWPIEEYAALGIEIKTYEEVLYGN